MSSSPTARIDIHLQELMPMFFDNVRADLAAIREALDRDDTVAMRTVSHGVKGAAAGFGFHELARLSATLEQDIAVGTARPCLASQLDALVHYLDTVTITYEDTGEF